MGEWMGIFVGADNKVCSDEDIVWDIISDENYKSWSFFQFCYKKLRQISPLLDIADDWIKVRISYQSVLNS